MAAIAAERVVLHLERAGFVAMKRPPSVGRAAIRRGSMADDVLVPCAQLSDQSISGCNARRKTLLGFGEQGFG
jgi:hypothetical protein